MNLRLPIALLAASSMLLVAQAGPKSNKNWPGFRGPAMAGVAADAKLPEKWSKTDGVTWSAAIPGNGWSSPIVWEGTVYLTTAVGSKEFKQPSPGIYGNDYAAEMAKQGLSQEEIMKRLQARDIELGSESGDLRYMLYALDAKTGKVKWEQEVYRGAPAGRHRKNTFASETPFTDGKHIYVSFGQNVGMFCFDMKGKLEWKKQWEPKKIYLDFGTASSPTVYDGRVYLIQDNEEESYLTALDAKTGNEVWRTKRDSQVRLKSSWATPFIWKNEKRTEVIALGQGAIISYDLDGKELWRVNRMPTPSPSPVAANGMLYVGIGSQGDVRPMYAIKPGASGDITLAKDTSSNEYIQWFQPRVAGYTPSPLVYEGRVFLVHDTGVMAVLDAADGKEIYKARVGGTGNTFSASPVGASGRVYVTSEEGATFVLDAKAGEYKELSRNDLGEMSLSSPAVAGDALYIRTQSKLYKIGK